MPDSPTIGRPLVAVTASTEIHDGVERVRLNRVYVDAIAAAGLVPLIVPPVDPALATTVLNAVQGLVLTGGEDVAPERYGAERHAAVDRVHQGRDASEIALAVEARRRGMPTLAICRGIQLVNVAFGGTLIQDIPSQCPAAGSHDHHQERAKRVHAVLVSDGSRLASALEATNLRANSMHHQSVEAVAPGFVVTARANDGVVEGLEADDDDWWMLAVQWHPEELATAAEPWDRNLFSAFAAAVRNGSLSK